jgi:hypothetical protein
MEAEEYLERVASVEPASLTRYLFDQRVISISHSGLRYPRQLTTTVGDWLRQLAAAHRN